MRIISCHIENFGKIQNRTFDFNNGYNAYCYENGWGKSTLVAFIRVMFYGFDGERKRSESENERKFYNPWQGGVFGGEIVFEKNHKKYKMRRIFGTKEAEDIFELRDAETNLESHDFSSNIGEEIFEIDSEAFKRTVFISQNDCVTSATGDINAKMGNLTENTDDLTNFDAADQYIKDFLNKNTSRKKTGLLYKLKNEETDLETQVKQENVINNSINELQKKINEERENLDHLKDIQTQIVEKQKIVSEYKDKKSQKDKYEGIISRYSEAKEEWEKKQQLFLGEIPNKAELADVAIWCSEANKNKGSLTSYEWKGEELHIFSKLGDQFKNGVPSEKEFLDIRNKTSDLQRKQNEQKVSQLNSEEVDNLKRYQEKFGTNLGLIEKLSGFQSSWTERMNKSNMLSMKEENLMRMKDFDRTSKQQSEEGKISPIFIFGIIMAVVGIVMLVLEMLAPGIIVIVAGILCLIFGIMRKPQNQAEEVDIENPQISKLKSDIEQDRKFIDEADKEIKQYFTQLEMDFDINLVPLRLQELLQEAIRYEDLCKKDRLASENNNSEECEKLEQEIREFCERYHRIDEEVEFFEVINALEKEVNEYKLLKKKEENYQQFSEKYNRKKDEINTYFKKLGYMPQEDFNKQLLEIQDNFRCYQQAKASFQKAKQEKEDYEEHNDIKSFSELFLKDDNVDLTELNREYENNNSEMEEVKQRIKGYENQLERTALQSDEIATKKEQLEAVKKEKEEVSKKYKLIEKTREFLTQAKESLTARYMGPLKESFSKYYEMMVGELADCYHIDANAKITVEELGLQRDVESYSSGYKDLIGLCLRLAFIEAMYKEEKPMIILDDPFVNLDQIKVEGGKNLLKNIARDYQIIYLTCNESRK